MKITTFIIALVAVAAIILAGCGGGGSGSGGGSVLTGTIRDSSTNEPLSGVRVALGSSSTTTDSNGNFRLTGLSTGSGILTAQLNNYEISSVSVTVAAGVNPLSAPVLMVPVAGDPPDSTPRTLQGTITLTGESNASGAVVTLLSGSITYDQMTTTSNGSYHFWAPAGTYTLRVSKSGFVSKSQQVTITDLSSVKTVNVTLLLQ